MVNVLYILNHFVINYNVDTENTNVQFNEKQSESLSI